MKILFVVTEDWYFVSHRLALAVAAREAGYEVAVATRVTGQREKIEAAGIRLIELRRMRRSSLNPYHEARAFLELVSIYRNEKPDIVHQVALKPVIYGTLAARTIKNVSWVNALGGLGFAFSSRRKLARLLRPMVTAVLRLSLNSHRGRVIVQNPDDFDLLVEKARVNRRLIHLIRGAGVDMSQYRRKPFDDTVPIVVLASRMLWDKGVGEFVAAAELVRRRGINARFVLVGQPDPENPGTVSEEQLRTWDNSGVVEWWGYRTDMPTVLSSARIVCLPSYYGEGVPKVLIEAMACGRPIITTDMPGCRELVRDGVNGILVPPREIGSLCSAFLRLLSDSELCEKMGNLSWEIAAQEFSFELVLTQTKKIYAELKDA